MSDEIDRANEQAQVILGLGLKARRPEGPQPTGYCLNCDEPLPIGRWCDANCRDDWERLEGVK